MFVKHSRDQEIFTVVSARVAPAEEGPPCGGGSLGRSAVRSRAGQRPFKSAGNSADTDSAGGGKREPSWGTELLLDYRALKLRMHVLPSSTPSKGWGGFQQKLGRWRVTPQPQRRL